MKQNQQSMNPFLGPVIFFFAFTGFQLVQGDLGADDIFVGALLAVVVYFVGPYLRSKMKKNGMFKM